MASGTLYGYYSDGGKQWYLTWSTSYVSAGVSRVNWSFGANAGSDSWTEGSYSLNINGQGFSSGGRIKAYAGVYHSDSFLVYHNTSGIGSFYMAMTESMFTYAEYSHGGTYYADTNYPYTSCKAPTSFIITNIDGSTISNGMVLPNQNIKLAWNGASSGTNNAIKGYKISFNNTTYEITSSSTSGTYTLTVPSTRGLSINTTIQTIGERSGYNSSTKSAATLHVNRKPTIDSLSGHQYLAPNSTQYRIDINGINDIDANNSWQSLTLNYTVIIDSGEPETGSISLNTGQTSYIFSGSTSQTEQGHIIDFTCSLYDGLEYSEIKTYTISIIETPICELVLNTKNDLQVYYGPDPTSASYIRLSRFIYGGKGTKIDNSDYYDSLPIFTSSNRSNRSTLYGLNNIKLQYMIDDLLDDSEWSAEHEILIPSIEAYEVFETIIDQLYNIIKTEVDFNKKIRFKMQITTGINIEQGDTGFDTELSDIKFTKLDRSALDNNTYYVVADKEISITGISFNGLGDTLAEYTDTSYANVYNENVYTNWTKNTVAVGSRRYYTMAEVFSSSSGTNPTRSGSFTWIPSNKEDGYYRLIWNIISRQQESVVYNTLNWSLFLETGSDETSPLSWVSSSYALKINGETITSQQTASTFYGLVAQGSTPIDPSENRINISLLYSIYYYTQYEGTKTINIDSLIVPVNVNVVDNINTLSGTFSYQYGVSILTYNTIYIKIKCFDSNNVLQKTVGSTTSTKLVKVIPLIWGEDNGFTNTLSFQDEPRLIYKPLSEDKNNDYLNKNSGTVGIAFTMKQLGKENTIINSINCKLLKYTLDVVYTDLNGAIQSYTLFNNGSLTYDNEHGYTFNTNVSGLTINSFDNELVAKMTIASYINNNPGPLRTLLETIDGSNFKEKRESTYQNNTLKFKLTATDIFDMSASVESETFSIDFLMKPIWLVRSNDHHQIFKIKYANTHDELGGWAETDLTNTQLTLFKDDNIILSWNGDIDLNSESNNYTQTFNNNGKIDGYKWEIWNSKDNTLLDEGSVTKPRDHEDADTYVTKNYTILSNLIPSDNISEKQSYYIKVCSYKTYNNELICSDWITFQNNSTSSTNSYFYRVPFATPIISIDNDGTSKIDERQFKLQYGYHEELTNIFFYNNSQTYLPLERIGCIDDEENFKFELYAFNTYDSAENFSKTHILPESENYESWIIKHGKTLKQPNNNFTNFDIKNTQQTITNTWSIIYLVVKGNLAYARANTVLYPGENIIPKESLIPRISCIWIQSYSSVFTMPMNPPTIAYRANQLGMNIDQFSTDDLIILQNLLSSENTRTHNLIKLQDISNSNTITINIQTGAIEKVIIDGGTWDN